MLKQEKRLLLKLMEKQVLNLEVTKELSALHYELHSINLKLNNLVIEQEVFSKSAKDVVEYELLKGKLNIKLSECVNKIETAYLLLDEFEEEVRE